MERRYFGDSPRCVLFVLVFFWLGLKMADGGWDCRWSGSGRWKGKLNATLEMRWKGKAGKEVAA